MRPRSLARRLTLQYLYMIDVGGAAGAPSPREFLQGQEQAADAAAYAQELINLVCQRRREIDHLLTTALQNWNLGRVAAVELNTMRLGVGELIAGRVPPRVALDEAIKLAKKFGGRDSGAFVNGVLDRVYQNLGEQGGTEPDTGTEQRPLQDHPPATAAPRCVDLHAHSNFSDGVLTPEELVEQALRADLAAVALTDHDNVDGLDRFARAGERRGLRTVAGVELSSEHEGVEVHVIGLLLHDFAPLRERLANIRDARASRMQDMLKRLAELGYPLVMTDIAQEAGRSFGRPHLARAMVDKGYVRSTGEAFARFIGDNGPAYVPKARLPVGESIRLIHACGGLAVLGHPALSGINHLVPEFAALGLDALEVFYPRHNRRQEQELKALAREHGLGISGGSDFHGHNEGGELGCTRTPCHVLEELERLAYAAGSRR